jgi:hypothetical protein
MRHPRLVTALFATAIAVTASGLAVAPPAFADNPIYQLVNEESGQCLQPIHGSHVEGAAVVQEPCNGSAAQQWTQTTSSSGTYVHLVNRASGLCLDARGGAVNGTPIEQYPCVSISNIRWSYGITNNLLSSGVSGTYSHCVATPGLRAGLPMELQFCDGDASQLWHRSEG